MAVAETLQNFVASQDEIYGGDISNIVDVMENIVSINDRDNKTKSKKLLKVMQLFVSVICLQNFPLNIFKRHCLEIWLVSHCQKCFPILHQHIWKLYL